MASSRQGDLFGHDEQDDLLGDQLTPVYHADPDQVRADCTRFSRRHGPRGRCRGSRRACSLYRTIFPQMTNWLPEEEGAQLRFEFETELTRLEAA